MNVCFSILAASIALSGCAQVGIFQRKDAQGEVRAPIVADTPVPDAGAQSAEALDTTTPEQRRAAAAPVASGARVLGTTVASLGSPTEPGFWLKTPLVKSEMAGSVKNRANGKSASVMLIPIEAEATAGSRMSLPAMRLIDASLTDLTEVEVSVTP